MKDQQNDERFSDNSDEEPSILLHRLRRKESDFQELMEETRADVLKVHRNLAFRRG